MGGLWTAAFSCDRTADQYHLSNASAASDLIPSAAIPFLYIRSTVAEW